MVSLKKTRTKRFLSSVPILLLARQCFVAERKNTTVWKTLEDGLEAHNDKEEKILYPAGDDLLTADLGKEILTTLADPNIPEGWTCEMSGRS